MDEKVYVKLVTFHAEQDAGKNKSGRIANPTASRSAEEIFETKDRILDIEQAIRRLPEELHRVLTLQLVGQMNSTEIGKLLDIPGGNRKISSQHGTQTATAGAGSSSGGRRTPMMVELSGEWGDMEEEELMPDLLAWAGSVQLTENEAASIKNSIFENITGYRQGWLDRMSARIDRTMARSQRRIDQSVVIRLQFQTDWIDRRLNTGP